MLNSDLLSSTSENVSATNGSQNGTENANIVNGNNLDQQQHHAHVRHNPSSSNLSLSPGNGVKTERRPRRSTVLKPKKPLPPNGKKTKGRVKIKMEFIENKLRRYTTFSKRKTGIMKKAYELSTLTGTQVMLLVASETGHVYTFATRKLQPMITSESGKALIQTCLNSPDPPNCGSDAQRMSATGYEEIDLSCAGDLNGMELEEAKDDEMSESESSDGDGGGDQGDDPSGFHIENGVFPSNFAALFASASAGNLSVTKGGLSIGLASPPSDANIRSVRPPGATVSLKSSSTAATTTSMTTGPKFKSEIHK